MSSRSIGHPNKNCYTMIAVMIHDESNIQHCNCFRLAPSCTIVCVKVMCSSKLKAMQWHIGKNSPSAMFAFAVLQLAQNRRLKLAQTFCF
jgi:hypothetical protein